jgi:hypothetical protein
MQYDTTYSPACPVVTIRINFNHRGQNVQSAPVPVLIDTGADRTCIPVSKMPPEIRHYQTHIKVRYEDGSRVRRWGVRLPDAAVDLQDQNGNWIPGKQHEQLLLLTQTNMQLLGRDVLNLHVSVFDGPSLACNIT